MAPLKKGAIHFALLFCILSGSMAFPDVYQLICSRLLFSLSFFFAFTA